ncbi:farnesylcysteine lyase [Olea europaea subsp. europaea]|uniref:Farnesylcysteine lyase n=1 Tax=Olea europaea subsp. europaea TaxID=158383 RepID=A0A8S0T7A4_OLEEU|nr:farnesylcysteine lyase [Olea europaea subsp. europaea]
MAAGLINRSDVVLLLHEEIESVSYLGDVYVLNSTQGKSYNCGVTVVATPLDELNIDFHPRISIPPRKLQHTHATFVRGLLSPASTKESPDVPFSSISILKQHENDMTYKIFSRETMTDTLLDKVFRYTFKIACSNHLLKAGEL